MENFSFVYISFSIISLEAIAPPPTQFFFRFTPFTEKVWHFILQDTFLTITFGLGGRFGGGRVTYFLYNEDNTLKSEIIALNNKIVGYNEHVWIFNNANLYNIMW